jgi:hypothetical protein
MATKKASKKKEILKWWKTENKLNAQQELFCQYYISSNKELFGNGVQSYIEAYNPDTTEKNRYKTTCASASRLLSNDKVINRINELLEEWGLNDQFVDGQLLFLIQQYTDFGSKMRAIWEYNKLKQRITQKIEHSGEINIVKETDFTD